MTTGMNLPLVHAACSMVMMEHHKPDCCCDADEAAHHDHDASMMLQAMVEVDPETEAACPVCVDTADQETITPLLPTQFLFSGPGDGTVAHQLHPFHDFDKETAPQTHPRAVPIAFSILYSSFLC